MRRFLIVGTAILLLGLFLAASPPAVAVDRGQMDKVSPSNPLVQKTFPAINGQMAPNDNPPHPNAYQLKAQYIAERCKTTAGAYCDTIFYYFDQGTYEFLYEMRVTLTWADPKGNNMDLFVWLDADVTGSSQRDCCAGNFIRSQTKGYPEVAKAGEPAGRDDPSTKNYNESLYWITVVNYSGVNSGYTLRLEFAEQTLSEFSRYSGRRVTTGSGSGNARSGSSSGRPSGFGSEDSSATTGETEIIKVPGPDGELIEMEVPVLAQQERRKDQGGLSPLIPISAAIVLLGAGSAGFFYLRARRAKAEA